MAERRMFAKSIIDSDKFLDMPPTTQMLYFHLSMRADDDGFVSNPKRIERMVGCSDDDLKLLIAKQFVIPFDSGIIVIKHWKIHNYIRSDRYKPSNLPEKALITVDENSVYQICGIPNDNQAVYQMDTQVRLGKDRLELEKNSEPGGSSTTPENEKSKSSKPVRHKYGEYQNVLLSDEDMDKLKAEFPTDWESRIERLSAYMASTGKAYKNHLATIRCWAKRDKPVQKAEPKAKTLEELQAEYTADVRKFL